MPSGLVPCGKELSDPWFVQRSSYYTSASPLTPPARLVVPHHNAPHVAAQMQQEARALHQRAVVLKAPGGGGGGGSRETARQGGAVRTRGCGAVVPTYNRLELSVLHARPKRSMHCIGTHG